MPDEHNSEKPARNAEHHPSDAARIPEAIPPLIHQDEVGNACKSNSEQDRVKTSELSKEVHWTQHAMLITQIGLALIGIVALGIYALQWCEMRKATKATQDSVTNADRNFRRDERAWVAFSFVAGNITFTIGKTFLVPTLLINTGKTPAKSVEGNIVVGVFERGKPLDFSYAPGHANYRVAAGTIFPNGSITESFEGIEHGTGHANAIIITKPLAEEILSSRSLVIVHGRITYHDIFGEEHWTTYCRVVSNPSLIPEDCTHYNNTDD